MYFQSVEAFGNNHAEKEKNWASARKEISFSDNFDCA